MFFGKSVPLMGGPGSGRWGGRPTVEGCGSLRLPAPRVGGLLREGGAEARGGADFQADGKRLRVEIRLRWPAGGAPHALLRHRTWDGTGEAAEYRVGLERRRAGSGWRWFWLCPITGQRHWLLVLPRGGRRFASVGGHGLGRRVQRLGRLEAAQRTVAKLRARLAWNRWGDPKRSRGMRRATFERLVERLREAEDRVEVAHGAWVDARLRRG